MLGVSAYRNTLPAESEEAHVDDTDSSQPAEL